MCEIGMSFALPSNGLSVLSPTRSSEVYIQEINTLKGMTSQTVSLDHPLDAVIEAVEFPEQTEGKQKAEQFDERSSR
jgi:hypothetical protein